MEKICWADRVKKWTIKSQKDETNILHTIKRRMANWVGHFLRRDDRRDGDTRKKA